jgi:hypothetical protein
VVIQTPSITTKKTAVIGTPILALMDLNGHLKLTIAKTNHLARLL